MNVPIPDESLLWPGPNTGYLMPEDLEHRRAYRLVARKMYVGFWNASVGGFIGISVDAGSYFVDMERHWDDGAWGGSAKPLQALGVFLPDDAPFTTNEGSFCQLCDKEVEKLVDPDTNENLGYTHLEVSNRSCEGERTYQGYVKANMQIFNLLDEIDCEFEAQAKEAHNRVHGSKGGYDGKAQS